MRDTWRNRFNHMCQRLWHYLNQPLFERDVNAVSRWPAPLTDRAYQECVEWLDACWQIDLPEHAEKIEYLERCWQRQCISQQQG